MPAEPMDRVVIDGRAGRAHALDFQRFAQRRVREILSGRSVTGVQPIVERRGAPRYAVDVGKRQIAQRPGNRRQVSDEPMRRRDSQAVADPNQVGRQIPEVWRERDQREVSFEHGYSPSDSSGTVLPASACVLSARNSIWPAFTKEWQREQTKVVRPGCFSLKVHQQESPAFHSLAW